MDRRESLTRKHMAERRRRAKINYYLDEIEALITPQGTKNAVKMEKAELLEKTVAFLRSLRLNGYDPTHQLQYRQAALLASNSQQGLSALSSTPYCQVVFPRNGMNFSNVRYVDDSSMSSDPELTSERSRSPSPSEESSSGSSTDNEISESDGLIHTERLQTKTVSLKKEASDHDCVRNSGQNIVWQPWR